MQIEPITAADILAGYVSFGLALYAITSLIGLTWIRLKKKSYTKVTMRKLFLIYACNAGLIGLEVMRQIWDTIYYEHFPLSITRAVLPVLYLTLGNSVFSLVRTESAGLDYRAGADDPTPPEHHHS